MGAQHKEPAPRCHSLLNVPAYLRPDLDRRVECIRRHATPQIAEKMIVAERGVIEEPPYSLDHLVLNRRRTHPRSRRPHRRVDVGEIVQHTMVVRGLGGQQGLRDAPHHDTRQRSGQILPQVEHQPRRTEALKERARLRLLCTGIRGCQDGSLSCASRLLLSGRTRLNQRSRPLDQHGQAAHETERKGRPRRDLGR